jgi:hypothetical protein
MPPKKGGPARTCNCGHPARNKGAGPRTMLTAIGPIRLTRTYFSCSHCRLGGYPVDDRLGLHGRLSARAEHMITLAGVHQSFAHASSLLDQLAGWTTCHEIIRQVCYRQADELAEQRQAACPEIAPFRQAPGRMEFQTDATKVNTLDGWRDMKIGVFAKRQAGPAATAEQWDKRKVPSPTARYAFAAIEEIQTFAPRWWPVAEQLGLGAERLSVFGDGAEWIWEHAEQQFAYWLGTLDIHHSGEWLAKGARAGCGEGTPEAARWLQESRLALLRDSYVGLCEYLNSSVAWVPNRAALEEAAGEILNYFCGHRDRLNYAARLLRGEPIGSGLIEGACKQMIGRRMKQTGAQWAVSNADRMALLCSIAYADAFPLYFTAA